MLINLIRTSPNSSTMLSAMAEALGKEFQTNLCLLISGINGQEKLQTAFWSQDNSILMPNRSLDPLISPSLVEEIAIQREPLAIADWQERYQGLIAASLLEIVPAEAFLVTGTRFRQKVNGLIVLGHTKPHQWTTQEKDLLKILSEIVAIAFSLIDTPTIINDNIYPRDVLPNPNTRNLDDPILKIWYEATRKQLEQQRQLNEQLINNIITTMSDQTRNPLATMRMVIEMLRRTQLSPESQQQRLDILEQEWHKLNNINERILQLKKLKFQSLNFQPQSLNLEELIEDVSQFYREQWQQDNPKNLSLEVNIQRRNTSKSAKSSPLIIETDKEHLKAILKELFLNASKFSLADTTVLLTVTEEIINKEKKIVITLANASRCIASENLKYLFEPFYREQGVINDALPGVGLGLTIIKELVQLLQGEIKVFCTPTTTPQSCMISFKLILPQSLSQQ